MVSRISSIGLMGIDGFGVQCECDLSGGLPAFEMVGLPDASVKEARDRVRSAAKNCGFEFPLRRITVNLAPADVRKEGPMYDLPILLSVLSASEQLMPPDPDWAFVGELSLSGELRPVNGALPMAIAAREAGFSAIFMPADNAPEAVLAGTVTVYAVTCLKEVVEHLSGTKLLKPAVAGTICAPTEELPDFSDVRGQQNVRRAVEIAAAGSHNVLLIGPPGAGKSMIARRIPSILPDMTREEALESTKIHSISGLTNKNQPMLSERPFRSPHHTVSSTGLSGGGRVPHPGEISLAHNGVLFLDELPEFSRDTLEALRQPLEDGRVTISRVAGTLTFPSRFMLVCAMNPCRCGWYGHPSGRCTCSRASVQNYLARVSGPLLDRIDLHVEVPSVSYDAISSRESSEPSEIIRERVNAARRVQSERYAGTHVTCNAAMPSAAIREFCRLDADASAILRAAFDRLGMTARSHDRILRVARTIADMARSQDITAAHIAEALQYRCLDRQR